MTLPDPNPLLLLCILVLMSPTTGARESAVSIDVKGATLHGTLLQPQAAHHSKAAALIIAGSGPTDRDGNGPLGGPNNLKQLAQGLQRCGVTSLRYDKRGSRAGALADFDESSVTIDDFVQDAISAARYLQQRDDVAVVWLIGHSEGGLIALAAHDSLDARRVILLATSSERYLDILRRQLDERLPPDLQGPVTNALDALRAGQSVTPDSLPASLAPLFRASVQPFLRSADALEPLDLIARIEEPVLVVQGETDLQVRVADARALAASAPLATLEVIAGMNHVLKQQDGDLAAQTNSYSDPTLPLHPDLLSALCPPDATLSATVAEPVAMFDPAIPGDWSGRIKRIGLKVVFHFTQTEQGLGGTFDSPDQGAFGLPLSIVSEENGELIAASSAVGFRYQGTLRRTKKTWVLDGDFAQAGQTFGLKLTRHR